MNLKKYIMSWSDMPENSWSGFNEFTNSLRIAIVPDENEDARIKSILDFCITYGFKNVMLFINAEEFNQGHMSKIDALPWVKTIKKAKKLFESFGLSVSLNPWITIGHLDRGRTLASGQRFMNMTDFNGSSCNMVACPLDEEWTKYYTDFLSYLIKETQPEVVWIEDDFRLHNHEPLEYGGCFCEKHMGEYNKMLNASYTRKEFVEKVFKPGAPTPERKCWLDISKKTMLSLAEKLGECIEKASDKTKVGLMSSTPQSHCMEARDWHKIHSALSRGKTPINRIHLPCYIESTGKDYYRKFNSISMAVRAFLPENCIISPELENSVFSTYSKDSRFLRFQLESALPLKISGMTYDIFDFVGNGPNLTFGYGETVKEIENYLDAVTKLNFKFNSLSGVVVPIDEKICYKREIQNGWQDLIPDEFNTAAYLSSLGVAYKYSTEKTFENETVALFGNSANLFTNSQMELLFKNNRVILDGGTVLNLDKRGLIGLIRAVSAHNMGTENTNHTHEKAADGIVIDNIAGYRASAQRNAGEYVSVEYRNDSTSAIMSDLYNERRERVGNGFAKSGGFCVIPYILKAHLAEQYNPLRRNLLCGAILDFCGRTVITEFPGIHPYLYEDEINDYIILVNATVNSFDKVKLKVSGLKCVSIEKIGIDGKTCGCKFNICNNEIILDERMEYLSTMTLIIKK